MRYCLIALLGWVTLAWALPPAPGVKGGESGAVVVQRDGPPPPLILLQPPRRPLNGTAHDYDVPNTDISLEAWFYDDQPVSGIVMKALLLQCITEVLRILTHSGDGYIPGQNYIRDLDKPPEDWIHLGIWPWHDSSGVLTWGFVRDTLVGLWYFFVTKGWEDRMEARILHTGGMGIIGFVFIDSIDDENGRVDIAR
ncbi:MAG: hypothetical protein Q9220_007290 [cf. Caloplaca sp. 1 TL-2023]